MLSLRAVILHAGLWGRLRAGLHARGALHTWVLRGHTAGPLAPGLALSYPAGSETHHLSGLRLEEIIRLHLFKEDGN